MPFPHFQSLVANSFFASNQLSGTPNQAVVVGPLFPVVFPAINVLVCFIAIPQTGQEITGMPRQLGGEKWRRVGHKFKSELSATIEIWSGWGFGAGTDLFTDITFDFDRTATHAYIIGRVYDGAAQRDDWVSPPTWVYSTTPDTEHELKVLIPSNVANVLNAIPPNNNIVGVVLFAGERGSASLTTSNVFTVENFNPSIPWRAGWWEAGIYDSTIDAAHEINVPRIRHSASALLAVSVNIFAPEYFDTKGTSSQFELEEIPEDEMRYKERANQLERELAETRETQARDQEDFVSTNRQLTTERNGLSRTLTDLQASTTARIGILQSELAATQRDLQQAADALPAALSERDAAVASLAQLQAAASEQVAQLQAELDTVRAELQQTLAALPQVVADAAEQMFQTRLNQLLSTPDALRALLMEHARQAQAPRDLFGALQSIKAL